MLSLQQRHSSSIECHSLLEDQETETGDVSSDREWSNYTRSRNTVFRAKDDDNKAFQVKGTRTQIRSWELYKISKGEHIGWHRPCSVYWHHAIVADIDLDNRRLLVIHYSKENGAIKILKEWIDVEKQKGDMFLFQYSSEIQENNSTSVVLKRAHRLVGRKCYNLFKNNCEHLATYCKTGNKESVQVRWVSGKVKETAMTTAVNITKSAVRLGCDIGKGAARKSGSFIATGGGKVAVAEGIETIGKASNWVGAGLVVGLETAHCVYDIYRLRKSRKQGNMSERDFRVTATQRISEGVFGSAGAIGGGLLGGFIGSFIPVIGTAAGTFIGSVIGGAIGSIAGKFLGSLFGGWFGNKLW